MGLNHSPRIVTDGLAGYWDAGNPKSYPGSGTTWTDLSGRNNNLTITGSPTLTNGYFTFNGSTQYARTTTLPTTNTTNFSLCAWINPSNINQLGLAVANGRDDGVNLPFDGYAFGVGNGAGSAGSKFQVLLQGIAWIDTGYTYTAANTWYNIVWTRDTTTSRFYVNGTQTASTSASTPSTPTSNFSVGAAFGDVGARFFAGSISTVKIYTKQLSASEVNQNYNAHRGRFGL
jgi:hypothetical protein